MEDIAGRVLRNCLPKKDRYSKQDVTKFRWTDDAYVYAKPASEKASKIPGFAQTGTKEDADLVAENCPSCGKKVTVPWSSDMEGIVCPYCKKKSSW